MFSLMRLVYFILRHFNKSGGTKFELDRLRRIVITFLTILAKYNSSENSEIVKPPLTVSAVDDYVNYEPV